MSLNTPNHRQYSQALSRNNAYNSSGFNGYIGILEGAEGSIVLREQILEYLKSLVPPGKNRRSRINSLDLCNSIREATAYIASFVGNGGTQERLNGVIESIFENILKDADLSESAVIRLSALNRVPIKLTQDELLQLNTIENELQEILNQRVPDLARLVNFKNETNAQRIKKIDEVVNYLITRGILTEIPENFQLLQEKLSPLHTLDSEYHKLNHARNNFYKIQQGYGDIVVLSSNEKKELSSILQSLVGMDLEKYLEELPKDESLELENMLTKIKMNNNDIEDKLHSLNMSLSDFERFYLFYFSQENLKRAKIRFDTKKKETFGDKTRDFDLDTKKWREIQRDRLIQIAVDNNAAQLGEPEVIYAPYDRGDLIENVILHQINEGELQTAENIFERDRKLFLRTGNQENDRQLYSLLLLILCRRYPSVDGNIIINLTQAIFNENDVTNELYYGDRNTLVDSKDDTGIQNILKGTGNAGRNIQKVEKFTTPVIKGFTQLAQKALELTGKGIGSVITGTTGGVNSVMTKYNTWANAESKGFFQTIWKLPFKASQILTRPLGWGTQGADFIANKGVSLTSGAYTGINDIIKKASNDKIDSLFDVFSKTYSVSLGLLGKGVEWSGNTGFDILKTEQKREILSRFYNTSNVQELGNMLDSIDITTIIKDSSPYIFDFDGFDNLPFNIETQETKIDFDLLKDGLIHQRNLLNQNPNFVCIGDLFNILIDELNNPGKNQTQKLRGLKNKINRAFMIQIRALYDRVNNTIGRINNEIIQLNEDRNDLLAVAQEGGLNGNVDTINERINTLRNELQTQESIIHRLFELGYSDPLTFIFETIINIEAGIRDDGTPENNLNEIIALI